MRHGLLSSHAPKALPLAAIIIAASLVCPVLAQPQPGGNPFDQLKGNWTGGGTVTPNTGEPKKVNCKATYEVAGNALTQKLRCAGPDYKVDSSTKMTYKSGKISGSWKERTYDASGGISGTATDNLIHARISGDRFSGRMSINVSGDGHSINIVQLDKASGVYRPVAALALRR